MGAVEVVGIRLGVGLLDVAADVGSVVAPEVKGVVGPVVGVPWGTRSRVVDVVDGWDVASLGLPSKGVPSGAVPMTTGAGGRIHR